MRDSASSRAHEAAQLQTDEQEEKEDEEEKEEKEGQEEEEEEVDHGIICCRKRRHRGVVWPC